MNYKQRRYIDPDQFNPLRRFLSLLGWKKVHLEK